MFLYTILLILDYNTITIFMHVVIIKITDSIIFYIVRFDIFVNLLLRIIIIKKCIEL